MDGKPRRPSSIGGVLKDYEGNFLCVFSYSTCIKESNMVKVLAIRKALQVCIDCFYALIKNWIVEFDIGL